MHAEGELSHRLWIPDSHGAEPHSSPISSIDASCDLVPATGPEPLGLVCSFCCEPLLHRLHPPVPCADWLNETPPASSLIHRIEPLPDSAQSKSEGPAPLDPSVPVLLSDSPTMSYVSAEHYASLVERYNVATRVERRDGHVLFALLLAWLASLGALLMLPGMSLLLSVQLLLGVWLPVSAACFVTCVVLLYRHMRGLFQAMVRRVLEAVQSANGELAALYEQAARGSEGKHVQPRRCMWRWLTPKSKSEAGTATSLCLVLAQQPAVQEGETL